MASNPIQEFLASIPKRVDRGIYSVIDEAGEMAGIDRSAQKDIQNVAAEFIKRNVDAGLIDERERIDSEGRSGDLFNAINHGLLAYRYGDSPIIRGMLQGKEYLQQGQEYLRGRDPRTQYIDRMNNLVGYDLVGLSEEEALQEMLNRIADTKKTMRAGGVDALIPGKHFYLNPQDY